jgi:SAM-dependent methyltransferase
MLPREVRIGLRKIYYYGHTFTCSLCGASVRTLVNSGSDLQVLRELDVVGGFRANDSCPVCLMGARTRLIGRYLQRELWGNNCEPQRVLHIAPELWLTRIIQRQLANVHYVAADLYPDHYPKVLDVVKADITNLRWDANTFNLVVCNHVLEHVPADLKAMNELYRVMRQGGAAILQVPIARKLAETIEDCSEQCPKERERRFGQGDHVRIYGSDYVDRLRSAGFEVEIFDPFTVWGSSEIELFRLDRNERIFIGRK